MSELPNRDNCSYCIQTRGIDPKMLGCMGHYPANSSKHLVDREAGIECELARSRPLVEGGPYEIIVLSDVPANSLTMHNKLLLVPTGDADDTD